MWEMRLLWIENVFTELQENTVHKQYKISKFF